jgi:hypothetical protein
MAYVDPAAFAPVLIVNAVWLWMYYAFMQLGPQSKIPPKGTADHVQWGERCFGNLHEQSTPFLASLWVYAVFNDVTEAAYMGWACLFFRFLYPIIWAWKGSFKNAVPLIFISTLPMYSINIWMMGSTVLKGALGLDLKAMLLGSNIAVSFIGSMAVVLQFMFNATITTPLAKRWFKDKSS